MTESFAPLLKPLLESSLDSLKIESIDKDKIEIYYPGRHGDRSYYDHGEKITLTSKGSDIENIDLLSAIENIAKDNSFDVVLSMSKSSHDNESNTMITIRVEKTIDTVSEKDIDTYRKEVEINYLRDWNRDTSFIKKLKYIVGRG